MVVVSLGPVECDGPQRMTQAVHFDIAPPFHQICGANPKCGQASTDYEK
jgi:hypothetical protein